MMSLTQRASHFARDRFFLLSMSSVLGLNFLTVTLTWVVVFLWHAGFEYNRNAFWQLSTYGPVGTLLVTQITLAGIFIFVKSGMEYVSRLGLEKFLAEEKEEEFRMQETMTRIAARCKLLTRIVLLSIVAIIATDAVNDVSNVLIFLHIAL